jgi:hypothetical protein
VGHEKEWGVSLVFVYIRAVISVKV